MLKKSVLLLIFMVCLSVNVYAVDPMEASEKFCVALEAGDINSAYNILAEGSPLLTKKIQMVDALKQNTASMLAVYGNIIGHEFIKEIEVGDDVVYLYFLIKTQDVPICSEIVFYKPVDNWFMEKITFDDQCLFFRELVD